MSEQPEPEERAAGRDYRLPTEAEWEYACRAGTTTHFNTGESLELHQARFSAMERSFYGDFGIRVVCRQGR